MFLVSGILFSAPFSLFAAVTCMWLAYRRGLNVLYYGLIGAIYWILLWLPWVYLVTRMSGRRMPVNLIITGYIVLYLGWFIVLFFVYQLFILIPREISVREVWVSLVFIFSSTATAILSGSALILYRRRSTEPDYSAHGSLDGYGFVTYLEPQGRIVYGGSSSSN